MKQLINARTHTLASYLGTHHSSPTTLFTTHSLAASSTSTTGTLTCPGPTSIPSARHCRNAENVPARTTRTVGTLTRPSSRHVCKVGCKATRAAHNLDGARCAFGPIYACGCVEGLCQMHVGCCVMRGDAPGVPASSTRYPTVGVPWRPSSTVVNSLTCRTSEATAWMANMRLVSGINKGIKRIAKLHEHDVPETCLESVYAGKKQMGTDLRLPESTNTGASSSALKPTMLMTSLSR